MRPADVIKRLLIERQQLDETVKGLRKFLTQKMVLVDYGVIGWYHVYLALDVRDPNPRIIPLDQLGPAYEKLAYGYANPQLVRGMAKEATKTLSRLGFKKQRIITVLTDITKANYLTGGGTGGYYNRSEHILAINYQTNLADVETWTHEWAHFKMLGGTTAAEQKDLVHEIYAEAVRSSPQVNQLLSNFEDHYPKSIAIDFVKAHRKSTEENGAPGWGQYEEYLNQSIQRGVDRESLRTPFEFYTNENRFFLAYEEAIKTGNHYLALFYRTVWKGASNLYNAWVKRIQGKDSVLAKAGEGHITALFTLAVKDNCQWGEFWNRLLYYLEQPDSQHGSWQITKAMERIRQMMYEDGLLPTIYGGRNPNEFFAELVAKMATGGHTMDPKLKMIFNRFVSKIQ